MSRQRSIEIPRLVEVGPGRIKRLPDLLRGGFDTSHVLLGTGGGASLPLAEGVAESLRRGGLRVTHEPGLTGSVEQAVELAATAIRAEVTLLVGLGGGRVIDTVKLAASRIGAEFVSVPTAVSHDGISSPVASLERGEDGHRSSYAAAMPAGVILDLDVVGAAPVRTLRAGLGDLLSNLVAILDWELAAERGADEFDAYSALIAEHAARSALDVEDLSSPESHELLAKGLLLSGLAMAAAGTSRPCSGSEHLISHSLDRLLGSDAAMHGEQVAVGCLFAAAAHDSPLLETLARVFRRTGLPTAPADIGIPADAFEEAVRLAPATRPERFTVLTELVAAGGDRIPKLAERTFERVSA